MMISPDTAFLFLGDERGDGDEVETLIDAPEEALWIWDRGLVVRCVREMVRVRGWDGDVGRWKVGFWG